MNRRNFLKYLSSIPLIGIPVKALAEKKSGWNGIIESRSNVSLYKSKIDPYEEISLLEQVEAETRRHQMPKWKEF